MNEEAFACSQVSPAITQVAKPLRDQTWNSDTLPAVSILCPTFNHSKFIRDCLDGFLSQRTTFPVEIVVHDDASNDGTGEVVREYEAMYPHLFRCVIQAINLWPNLPHSITLIEKYCRGRFIATCEGDDYWFDPLKLQKQFDVLQSNRDVSLVFCNAWVKHDDSRRDYFLNHNLDKTRFSLSDVIERDWFMATAGLFFRRQLPMSESLRQYVMGGDMLLQITACSQGDAMFLNDVCSVYRRHSGGVSDECWKMGSFHFERMRPNHLWMFWLLKNEGFSDDVKQSLDRKVQSIIRLILGYAASVKGNNFLSRKDEMVGYIVNLLVENKPAFVGDDTLAPGSDLLRLVEGECQASLQSVPKPSKRSYVRQKLKSILRRLT
jgi:glycosyltransferase involved in cell wall biosynthesis